MSSHLPSAEPQLWPEFCSLLKNNWGQRGGLDVNHYQLLALLVLQQAGRAEQFGTGMTQGGEDQESGSLFWGDSGDIALSYFC